MGIARSKVFFGEIIFGPFPIWPTPHGAGATAEAWTAAEGPGVCDPTTRWSHPTPAAVVPPPESGMYHPHLVLTRTCSTPHVIPKPMPPQPAIKENLDAYL